MILSTLFSLALIGSCAPLKPIIERKAEQDPFSRTYLFPFKDFHPKLNQALQKLSRENPGNSFQIVRLGSDSVIFRGFYQKDRSQPRTPLTILVRPLESGKTKVNLEIPGLRSLASSSESPEAIGQEFFQIIEKEMGLLTSS